MEREKISRPVESPRLAGIIFGVKQEKTWQNSGEISWSLHDIIAHVVELGRVVGVKFEFKKISEELSSPNFHPIARALHPGRRVGFSVTINNNEKLPIGWCGEFHPKVIRNYEIETSCLGFELNIANIMLAANNLNQFVKTTVSTQKFPTVNRDFAFLLDEHITAEEIQTAIKNSLAEIIKTEVPVHLTDVHIFDIYRGKGVAQGKKSIAFKISLEPQIRTLTEKDIQMISDKVIAAMEVGFKSQLRS